MDLPKKIELFLSTLNFSHIWENQKTFSKRRLFHAIDKKLNEGYLHHWKESMFCDKNLINGNKLRTCRKIQENYNLEIYLLLDLDKNVIRNYTKIRINNSSLKIEQGRHNKTPLENRLCPLCLAEVEDEFHFTVKCTSLYAVRDKLYDEISAIIPSFVNMTDESKFKFMYTYSEYDVIRVIVKGINDMYNARNELLNNK